MLTLGAIKKPASLKLGSKIILANKDHQAPSFLANNTIALIIFFVVVVGKSWLWQ
ncbi:hypothetical protein [Borreliella mayonii]|uniref:hypothetical protein n=1 Tax=Borreliella mayonii TaxID=1674146 RepID=UPI001314367E|nr:hypothetical protein [Borreliella mayonii]